jgi:dTDP-4-amino-4,6-dideoxygalactose transaminase
MKVNFLDLKAQYNSIKPEMDAAISAVFEKTAFAGGPFVKDFEEKFAASHEVQYCIGVNSGTSALHSLMMALGIGPRDEVIIPANTFFATPESVSLCSATPVFADIENETYNLDPAKIEDKITPKTKAIIAVHLYGQPAKIDKIKEIADKHNLILIEDCAQAHMAELKKTRVGNFGVAGCFSFYPGKNLGAYGEGGAVVTNSEELYKKVLAFRDHGSLEKYHHDSVGHNYRMEGIQGAVLGVKMYYIEQWTDQRKAKADYYRNSLAGIEEIVLPKEAENSRHVYHLFVIKAKRRDELQAFLKENGIFTGIHYPIPCHLQKAYSHLGYKKGDFPNSEELADMALSLPMFPELKKEEIDYVSAKIREFYS